LPDNHFFAIVYEMAERSYLGELELMILLVLIHLGENAYGVPISRELERHRGREVSLGSVYASLERLEGKGLVVSQLGDPLQERGGRARRYFRITEKGLRQANETRQLLTRLWSQVPSPEGGHA
jgi:PadR family transcriptional regulator PadR